jgi:regulator of sigma E protease
LLSIVLTVLGLGLLIAAHEAGHLVLARLMGMRVETYSLGFGPRIAGFKRGDTDYRLSALPLGGYCRIAGFTPDDPAAQDPNDAGSYMNKPAWRRFLVIAAGPGVNYLAAFLILAGLYSAVGTPVPGRPTQIDVKEGGPAAVAGLKTGDEVLAIDGHAVRSFPEMITELRKPGAPDTRQFEVQRGAQRLTLPVKPSGGMIQVAQDRTFAHATLAEAVPRAAHDVWALNKATLSALWDVVRMRGTGSLSGPVGIVKQASAEVKRGLADFAGVLANISVGLAIFNFLPVPALDGGRLVFLFVELVSGRRVNQKAETIVHLIGFLLLLGLVIAVTVFGDLQLGKKLFHRG